MNKLLYHVLCCMLIWTISCCRDCHFPLEDLCEYETLVYDAPHLTGKFSNVSSPWIYGDIKALISVSSDKNIWLVGETALSYSTDDQGYIIANSLLLENNNSVSFIPTSQDDSLGLHYPFFPSEDTMITYVPTNGQVVDDNLEVILTAYRDSINVQTQQTRRMLSHTLIATVSLGNLQLQNIIPITSGEPLLWGISFSQDSIYTYVYGRKQTTLFNSTYAPAIARFPKGSLLQPWEYFDGNQWVMDPVSISGSFSRQIGDQTSSISIQPLEPMNYVMSNQIDVNVSNPGISSFSWTKTAGSGSWSTYNSGAGNNINITPSSSISFLIYPGIPVCPISRQVTFIPTTEFFSVFPNPVESELTVTSTSAYEIEYPKPLSTSQAPPNGTEKTTHSDTQALALDPSIEQVKLYDIEGNTLKKLRPNRKSKEEKLNVSELRPGTYIVELLNGDLNIPKKARTLTTKIVKQ